MTAALAAGCTGDYCDGVDEVCHDADSNGSPHDCEKLLEAMAKPKGAASANSSLLGRPVGANSEETRQRILEATMRCVAAVGYSRTTIREIAREANMTSGSLYHYFPNKAELVKATFDEVATIAVPPRLEQAAQDYTAAIDKLMAVLDESVRVMQDYPLAVAFDRAIRAESPQHLHLAENSDTRFVALRNLIRDILSQGAREKMLGRGVDVESAANAVYMIFRGGLNEYAASAPPPEEYHATVAALKKTATGGPAVRSQPVEVSRIRRQHRIDVVGADGIGDPLDIAVLEWNCRSGGWQAADADPAEAGGLHQAPPVASSGSTRSR